MGGICGWSGQLTPGRDITSCLESMGAYLGGDGPVKTTQNEHGSIMGSGKSIQVTGTEEVLIALHGRPRFSDTGPEGEIGRAISAAYLQRGAEIISDIHGSFSLAVIDLRDNSTLLAVDRLGIEPLAYTVAGHLLVFGSRADSVAAHPQAGCEIDSQSVFNYLYFHCIPSPRTIFRGQQKLRPGEMVRFRNGSLDSSFYWQLAYHDQTRQFGPLREECLSLLDQAVRNAADDCHPGAFLSGGIDSSTVSGMLAGKNPDTRTYSIGFEAQGYDEMEYARIAARHFKIHSVEYYVTPADVVEAIPLIAKASDEPFGNASIVPAYLCARLAANDGQSVLLAGDGGDEIFAGNERYAHQLLLEQYQKIPLPARRWLLEPVVGGIPWADRIAPLRKIASYISQAKAPLPDRMESYNFLNRTPLTAIFSDDFLETIDVEEPIRNLREDFFRPDTASSLNRMLHLDLKITLADNDLRKVNRACEMAGIEVRYPMLDEGLVEFSGRVPAALKLRHLKLRYFLKRSLEDFLPREILGKSKHGFGLPFGLWMKEYKPLEELALGSLESLKSRHFVKPAYIDTLLQQHDQEHAAYYGVMVWVMMMLEQWLQAHTT